MTRLPDPATSRAVLIGFSRYDEARALPEIPAVRANLTDLRAALVNAPTGTLEHCTEVFEPGTTVADVGRAITSVAAEATDLLLVYYAGHGLVDERGRLHLALPSTDPARLRWTALPFEVLREEIVASPATTRVLVLDCCFSGRAIEAMGASRSVITGQIDIAGTYTLSSTTATALSHAPLGARHTAFTGAVLAILDSPRPLTLDRLFRRVDRHLASQGLPRPQRRLVNVAGDLVLFKGRPAGRQPEAGGRPADYRVPEPEEVFEDREARKVAQAKVATVTKAKLDQAAALFAARAAQMARTAARGDIAPPRAPGTATGKTAANTLIGSGGHAAPVSERQSTTCRMVAPEPRSERRAWQAKGVMLIWALLAALGFFGTLLAFSTPSVLDIGATVESAFHVKKDAMGAWEVTPPAGIALGLAILLWSLLPCAAAALVFRAVPLVAGPTVRVIAWFGGLAAGCWVAFFATLGGKEILQHWMAPAAAIDITLITLFAGYLVICGWAKEARLWNDRAPKGQPSR